MPNCLFYALLGVFWGWMFSSTLHQLWVCPSRTVTKRPESLILFLYWMEEMKMDSIYGSQLGCEQNWPIKLWLKESAAWREKVAGGSRGGKENWRGEIDVHIEKSEEYASAPSPFSEWFWQRGSMAFSDLSSYHPRVDVTFLLPCLKGFLYSISGPFLLPTPNSFLLL